MGHDATPLARLRDATGAAHKRLDAGMQVQARLQAPAARPDLLAGYKRLFATVEAATRPFLHDMPGLDFAKRCRAALIGAPCLPPGQLAVANEAAALGAFYVTEGATLGGRMLLRAVTEAGHGGAALAFLDPYGAENGTMWRDFCAVLNTRLAISEACMAEAVAAALATFSLAETCLAPRLAGRA